MYICLYIYVLVFLCLICVICFYIIVFKLITTNHIISLTQKNLLFRHNCQKFSLRVLLIFWLIFYRFQSRVSFKSVAYKKAFNSLSLFYIFCLSSLFKLSCTNKHHVYNLYCISYTLRFCHVMYYIVSEICVGGHFLMDCFYCYFQQIISAVAKESLIPYTLYKEHQKHGTFNTVTPSTSPNQTKKCKIRLSF